MLMSQQQYQSCSSISPGSCNIFVLQLGCIRFGTNVYPYPLQGSRTMARGFSVTITVVRCVRSRLIVKILLTR